jgi:hypothetical protein
MSACIASLQTNVCKKANSFFPQGVEFLVDFSQNFAREVGKPYFLARNVKSEKA